MIQLTYAPPYLRTGQAVCMACLFAGDGASITRQEALQLLKMFKHCGFQNARVHRHHHAWTFELVPALTNTWIGTLSAQSFSLLMEKLTIRYRFPEEPDVRLDPESP